MLPEVLVEVLLEMRMALFEKRKGWAVHYSSALLTPVMDRHGQKRAELPEEATTNSTGESSFFAKVFELCFCA